MESKNVEAVKRFYGYVDSGKPEALGTLFAPEAQVFYESGDPVSLDDMIPVIKTFYASFPDFKHIIEDIFEVGDRVVARMSFTGTFRNGFMGFEPNGSGFKYVGVHIFQFTKDRISTVWAVEDELGLMAQLGLELKSKKQ